MKSKEDSEFLAKCIEKWFNTELIYRATTDGFAATTFHSKCDNKGPNISIIKSESGYIFGGYTSLSWDVSGSYASDNSNPFIFSLTRKEKHLNHAKDHSILKS